MSIVTAITKNRSCVSMELPRLSEWTPPHAERNDGAVYDTATGRSRIGQLVCHHFILTRGWRQGIGKAVVLQIRRGRVARQDGGSSQMCVSINVQVCKMIFR